MTSKEIKSFQAILLAKQAQLSEVLRKREGISVDTEPADATDIAAKTAELEVEVSNLDISSQRLREVNLALRRIKNQEYGVCVSCEEEVGAKRLKAIPEAARCVGCQEEYEKVAKSGPEAFGELAVA